MRAFLNKNWYLIAVIVCLILYTYAGLQNTFYQQDEWMALGDNLIHGFRDITYYSSPLQIILSEGRALGRLQNLLFFGLFKFTLVPSTIYVLFLQIINSILIFFFAYRLTKNRLMGFFSALFFAVNGVSYQAITWAATLGAPTATVFVLISIISYFSYIKSTRKKFLYISFVSMLISLQFKEIGIFLIILYPIMDFIHSKKSSFTKVIKNNSLFIFYGLTVCFFRLYELMFVIDRSIVGGSFISGSVGLKRKLILHLALYPLTGISQIFYPATAMYKIAEQIIKVQYSFLTSSALFDISSQTIAADFLMALLSILILVFLWISNMQFKGKYFNYLLTAIAIISLCFLPYSILDRGSSYFDSRYYYIAGIGGGMIFSYFIFTFIKLRNAVGLIGLLICLYILTQHVITIKKEIIVQVKLANQRHYILKSIKNAYPTLKNNNVFYIAGDRDYIVPNNKIPMQQGTGYTLMVWYFSTTKIPPQLIDDNFLWNLGEQGYRSVDNRGFGFASDRKMLDEIVKKNKIPPENIISFYWNSKTQKLTNITETIRKTF